MVPPPARNSWQKIVVAIERCEKSSWAWDEEVEATITRTDVGSKVSQTKLKRNEDKKERHGVNPKFAGPSAIREFK